MDLGLAMGILAARGRRETETRRRTSLASAALEVVIPALTSPSWRACNPEEPRRTGRTSNDVTSCDGTDLNDLNVINLIYFGKDHGKRMSEKRRLQVCGNYQGTNGGGTHRTGATDVHTTLGNERKVKEEFLSPVGRARVTRRGAVTKAQ